MAVKEKKSESAQRTKVTSCSCENKSQDEMYGKGNRVFNKAGGKGAVKWRCTVCGKDKV